MATRGGYIRHSGSRKLHPGACRSRVVVSHEECTSMFTVSSLGLAVLFCVITMLGWGSWANTQKLAGKTKWPFEL
jgi:hypothetical protein